LLRGLSILLVVLHHVALRVSLKQSLLAGFLPPWLLNALMYNGYEAVFIFFVISGFLITGNTLARWGRLAALDWRAFYARRAARILPALLVLLAVLSLLHGLQLKGYAITRDGQSLSGALLAALGLYLNWYEGQTGYLPANWDVLWSLSVEELFYLGFPLLCLTLRRERLLLAAMVALALALPWLRAHTGGTEVWQEKAYLPGMAAIALGVAGAVLARRLPPPRPPFTTGLALAGSVGLGAVLLFESLLWPMLGYGSLLLLCFSALCLLLAFHWQAGMAASPWRFPGTGWLRQGGRLSYEIYLSHMFVVLPLVQLYRASGIAPVWGWLCYPLAVALCWLLGWGVARGLSQPAERALRDRLLRGLTGPQPAALARPARA
jgi:peptidoglycan/LPS O-acetylase OafA/YrhL